MRPHKVRADGSSKARPDPLWFPASGPFQHKLSPAMAAGSALEVRLITGETIKVQITPELSTIKLLKIFLAQDRDSLAGCQLFLNVREIQNKPTLHLTRLNPSHCPHRQGRQLPGRTPLATLPLGPGAFLVRISSI